MKLREEIISHLGLKGLSIRLKCQPAHTPKKKHYTLHSPVHAKNEKKVIFLCPNLPSPLSV